MPVDSKILPELGVVITTVSGSADFKTIKAHQDSLVVDPLFDPAYHHLFDLTHIGELRITTREIRELAASAIFSPSSRRAVVAPRDAHFGLSRMYEGFSHLPEEALGVFRSRDDALAWLGVSRDAS